MGPFAESIRNEASEFLQCDLHKKRGVGDPLHRERTKLDYTSELGMRLIRSVVREELDKDVDISGFDLLIDAIQSDEYDDITIVTLNHDVLIERLLAREEIPFENGFEQYSDNISIYNSDRLYSGGNGVRIIKPHGSISWYLSESDEFNQSNNLPVYVSINSHESSDPYQLSFSDKYDIITSLPSLLSSFGKEEKYGKDIYGDMVNLMGISLRSANSIIVSGYGWSDAGMNDRLLSTQNGSEENRLMLLRDTSDSERLPSTVRYFLEKNQADLVESWLCNATWDKVQQKIA